MHADERTYGHTDMQIERTHLVRTHDKHTQHTHGTFFPMKNVEILHVAVRYISSNLSDVRTRMHDHLHTTHIHIHSTYVRSNVRAELHTYAYSTYITHNNVFRTYVRFSHPHTCVL